MPSSKLICPTDNVQINENKVRITAVFVLLLSIAYLFTQWVVFPVFLAVDFALRAFNLAKFSILGFWAEVTVWQLNIAFKATDQAPKRFAAKIGFTFCLLISVFHFFSWNTWILTGVLGVFALLESALGFCAGCYVYTFYQKLLVKKAFLQRNEVFRTSLPSD